MHAAIVLLGFAIALPLVPSAAAASAAEAGCATVEAPADRLVCGDPALSEAAAALDRAMAALGETTDAAGREALKTLHTVWLNRRTADCPVAAADLADPEKAKAPAACLLRLTRERTGWAERQRAARLAPVAGIALTITDAAARPLAPIPARPATLTRPVTALALVGRWAKADPLNRAPLDDCRTSYLEVTRELTVALFDPRIPGLPVEGKLALPENATASAPVQEVALASEGGAKGTLRLDAAETPRVDRLFLRMEQPVTLGATYVRCR